MDTVLAAAIVLFLIVFAVLTLSYAFFSMQEMVTVSWQAMEARNNELNRTMLEPVSAEIVNNGTQVRMVVRNSGQARLSDFDDWDTILQYQDNNAPSNYHIAWMPYAPAVTDDAWTVAGLYMSERKGTPEIYEPQVLNPGEELAVEIDLTQAIGAGTTIQAVLVTPNGVSVSAFVTRNVPPTLINNLGITLPAGGTGTLGFALLGADDTDNVSGELVYTISAGPTQGTLSLGSTFTQADINLGLLTYTHTATGSDSFQFSISDGEAVIGPYTFVITVP